MALIEELEIIAIRRYPLDLEGHIAQDFVLRKPDGGYLLRYTSDNPREPESTDAMSLACLRYWFDEAPQEIIWSKGFSSEAIGKR